ncbi:DUF4251 domain-containing protein [Winogradskyella alexanderae]|uniref:DUF4251 domain-containing protein n=1 Tax=Winogradskyella alexanderae TaxID=2877123 RepID=A0ABS7XVC3_9FLAO|nr:DUF4251 domain-containing protein [Winogradskyella alexanderae]MCA0132776.1 DUF4251 domain-containing protein [Winogradskyella alexanderae]
MKFKISILLITFGTLMNCGSSKEKLSSKERSENLEQIRSALESKSFQFNAEFAFPLQSNDVIMVTNELMRGSQNLGGQVNLSGNYDFFKINGDTTEGKLSYFGEMRNVGYNDIADNSIIFSGVPINYSVEEKKNGEKIIIQFDAKNQVETFRIRMVVFNNYDSNVIIYGSNRTAIRYTGNFALLSE